MNPTALAILILASSNFVTDQIQRLGTITKPWQHTTYEQNIFTHLTDHDIHALHKPHYTNIYDHYQVPHIPAAQNFDSRTQWPQCIHPIRNQENCGASWAHSASEVFSDRACIQGIDSNYIGSVQQIISCDTSEYGCDGGVEYNALKYIEKSGLVDDSCYPYISGINKTFACDPNKINSCPKKHTGKNVKLIPSNSIMSEIMTNGPVSAEFIVFNDFYAYKSGIYVPTTPYHYSTQDAKIVGFGNENGIDYWTVANSFGAKWGEDGYFRIAMGTPCNIESKVYAIQVAN